MVPTSPPTRSELVPNNSDVSQVPLVSLQRHSTASDSFYVPARSQSLDSTRSCSSALTSTPGTISTSGTALTHRNPLELVFRLATDSAAHVPMLCHIPKPPGTSPCLLGCVPTFRNLAPCSGTPLYASKPLSTHGRPSMSILRPLDFRPCSDDFASSRRSLVLQPPSVPSVGTPPLTLGGSWVPLARKPQPPSPLTFRRSADFRSRPGNVATTYFPLSPLLPLFPSFPSDTFCQLYCSLSVPCTWHLYIYHLT